VATARSGADPEPRAGAAAPVVRAPRRTELPRLRDIEVAAGRPFAAIGMDWVAAHEPPAVAELETFVAAGLAWVVVPDDAAPAGTPAGYLIAQVVDEALVDVAGAALHIEQVSVDPAYAGRRLGRVLIERAVAEARARGASVVTLTTFRDVRWNAPYYERCGFRTVPDREIGPGLRRIRDAEIAGGLDAEPRVAMRRGV
jgi:GNAT superfamily N-acetyltransferase